jgi:hypothetical protein
MADFLADHNFIEEISDQIAALGHDVAPARRLGLRRSKDNEILLTAATTGRIILTHNGKHFAELHYAWLNWPQSWNLGWTPQHYGILSLPQMPPAERGRAAQAIDQLVVAQGSLTNELHVWRGGQFEQL